MSRLGAKTYSRKPECRTSVQFDHLLSEKGNKPSTAKVSVAGIHRWGMTSFTSIRKSRINGQKDVNEGIEPVKRVKLDPSPSLTCSDDPFSFESDIEIASAKSVHSSSAVHNSSSIAEMKPSVPKPNKFFKSGTSRLLSSVSNSSKNNDFDALRLSTNFSSLKGNKESHEILINMHSNFKSDVSHVSEEPHSLFLTSTSPNIVDLRYCSNAPNSCASTKYSNKPSVHYISPFIQPIISSDASSRAFDAIRMPDASSRAFDALRMSDTSSRAFDALRKPDASPQIFDTLRKPDASPQIFDALRKPDASSQVFDVLRMPDPTSQAFDALRTLDLSNKSIMNDSHPSDVIPMLSVQNAAEEHTVLKNEHVLNHSQLDSSHIIVKDNGVQKRDPSYYIEGEPKHKLEVEIPVSCDSKLEDTPDFGDSQSKLSSSSQGNDELSLLHSNKPEDFNSASKQSSRPKKIFSSSLKFKAVYNHRHWHSSKKELDEPSEGEQKASLADEFEDEIIKDNFNDALIEEVANTSSGDIRTYKCPKESKQFYTVVKNVKQAYQCHESGETQEFNDDIEYLLECVQECNGIGTRCLSVLNLAAKCMGPAFRIHIRAHGTMPKIFSALKDAPTDPNLALCTATLMFVLSQDRLTMDIEASTLSLMLQLLETDPEMRNPEKEIDLILKDPALCAMQEKHREKVYQLCEEMQQKGHAKHLKLDNINTGILAMETLLSLTSRKAGEWFKEEMRILHGLDRIADTVTSCVDLLLPEGQEIVVQPSEIQLDRIRKIDRCLRVLENVTHMNAENQEYLMIYKNSSLIESCLSLMELCKSHLLQQKPVDVDITSDEITQKSSKSESPILLCLLDLLKILSNITYRIPLDDSQFPSGEGFMEHLLTSILQVPRSVPVEKRFDLLVLSLGLMINLVEYCAENSAKFIGMYALGSFDTVNDGYEMLASEALVELMLSRLEAARVSEEQADELLSSQEEKHAASVEKKDVESAADDLEETLMKTLQKAGKHMEHSIIAAYIAILLGCVAQKNSEFADILRDHVPDGKFDVMVDVLKKFKSFVTLTGSVGSRELVFIQRVIQVLESS